jgi:hypothetical protein
LRSRGFLKAEQTTSAALDAAANDGIDLGHGDGIGEKGVSFVACSWL